MGDLVEVRTTGAAVGGGAVGRDPGGRAVFVDDALPGELVVVRLDRVRRRYARGRAVEVLEASPSRVAPPCPEVLAGCGGCDLQHATLDEQHSMKRAVVADVFERIAGVAAPDISLRALPSAGYRSTLRVGVVDGRAAFRSRGSHHLHAVESCMVAHPLLDELVSEGRFGSAREVTLRVGVRTGERMAVIDGPLAGVRLPPDVVQARAGARGGGAPPFIHEIVDGTRFRISAGSFFQSGPEGAEALTAEVRRTLDASGWSATPGTVVDLYAGVGLLGATAVDPAANLVAVEGSRRAAADARHNLSFRSGATETVAVAVEEWTPRPAEVVIADPSRSGLQRIGVERVLATGAATVVLVSCDAGALGRDAGLLVAGGYRVDEVTVVDLFPHTHHVEVVTRFTLERAG